MSLGTILVIILIFALLGGFSGRFGGYGYGFGHGGVGLLVLRRRAGADGSGQRRAEAPQMALELVDDSLRNKTALADGPLVEGAVAAAVQASLGSPLAAVKEVAEQAASMKKL